MTTSKTKRIMSLLLVAVFALTMALALPMSTSAAGGKGSITIVLPNTTQKSDGPASIALVPSTELGDMQYKAYQLLDKDANDDSLFKIGAGFENFVSAVANAWAGTESGTVTIYITDSGLTTTDPGNGADSVTISADAVKLINGLKNGGETNTAYLQGAILQAVLAADTNHVANEHLKKYIAANSGFTVKDAASNAAGNLTFANLDYGYWFVYNTAATTPEGVTVVEDIIFLGDGSESKTLYAKADYDDFDKQVRNPAHDKAAVPGDGQENEGTPASPEPFSDATTAAVGDVLEYQITFSTEDLKAWLDAQNAYAGEAGAKYTISDSLTNQILAALSGSALEYEVEDDFDDVFTIKLTNSDGDDYTLNSTDDSDIVTVTYTGDEDGVTGFSIDLDIEAIIDSLSLGADTYTITVTYKAILTEDAAWDNPNDAGLTYDRSPKTGGGTQTYEDNTDVYSFGIDVDKKFKDAEGQDVADLSDLYAGVKFELQQGGVALNFIDNGDGTYTYWPEASTEDPTTTTELKITSTGDLTIYGLDLGTYVLHETATPDGYTGQGDITFVIEEETTHIIKKGEGSSAGVSADNSDDTYKYLTSNYVNSLSNLPDINPTGGMGIWMAVIGGMMLVAMAAFVFKKSGKTA